MEKNQKLQILESFLREHGMSLDDPDVKKFFFEQRKTKEEAFRENAQRQLAYGPIEPTIYRVDPLQFENSGYFGNGDFTCLMDWLLYSNAIDNSLVFDNLGKNQEEIRKSFEERRRYSDPLLVDWEGKIYNSEDGNHRLLSLIINEFVEYAACRTAEERKAVRDKYELIVECSFTHDKELCDLLEKEKARYVDYKTPENADMFIPEAVREFRARNRKSSDTYLASYDPQTRRYKYDFNGEEFEGTASELKNFLKIKQKSKVPAMLWSDGVTTYASCNNFVVKSKNKQYVEKRFHQLSETKNAQDFSYKPYLVIFDADTLTYDVTVPAFSVDEGDSRLKTEIINFGLDFAEATQNDRFFELCDVKKEDVLKECHDGELGFVMAFSEMHFKNLSKDDYEYVLRTLVNNEKFITDPLSVMNQAMKFDEFAEKLFKVLPIIDDANETLLRISRGLEKNEKILNAGSKRKVTDAKQTFNFGKTAAQWGYGRIKTGVEGYLKIDGSSIVMPEYHKVEHPTEHYDDFEKIYARDTYLSSFESRDLISEQVEALKEQISELEEMKIKAYDRDIAKIADEIIYIVNKDIDAGEKLCTIVETTSDSSNEKE